MNVFRSEDHVRSWAQFKEGTEDGMMPLEDLMKLFSGTYFRRRLDPDWVSRSREYLKEWVGRLIEIGKTGPFWRKPK
jgi:two-component SAPR family response regulator